jgi:5'-3' exonuclease
LAKNTHLLIDGDIVLHRFGHSNQVTIDWDGDGEKATAANDEATAIIDVEQFIQELSNRFKSPEMTVCFSGPNNFRYSILDTYKWNRRDMVKPLLFGAIKNFLERTFLCMQQPTLEGDDLMGIISTGEPGKYTICSIDKDMLQIPGKHYNWTRTKQTRVTKAAGDLMFYMQVLHGDSGDGYTGIPGVGKVKATKILATEFNENPNDPITEPWERIVHAYEEAGLSEVHALQQARVARILRAGEYDFASGEVKLWSPS